MNILFANPRFVTDDGLIILPLDMAYAVSYCRQQGISVTVVDLAFSKNDDALLNELSKARYDLILLTCTTTSYKHALEAARRAKDVHNNIPVAIMGEHVTFKKDEVLKRHNYIDFVITFEAELTLKELIKEIVDGKSYSHVKGISYRMGNKIYHNEDRAPIDNLDIIPMPARELFALAKYKERDHETTMITSRGCTNRCLFCHRTRYGRRLRAWSLNRVINEINEILLSLGYKDIFFQDDVFCFNKKRTKALCERIIEEGLEFQWNCNVRMSDFNSNDPEHVNLVKLLKKSGCYRIFVGIESLSQKVLDKNNKKIDISTAQQFVNLFKENGIQVHASYVIGLPGDTEESVKATIEMAIKLNTDLASFNRLFPHPGTPLCDDPDSLGVIIPDKYWYEKEFWKTSALVGTKDISPEKVFELQKYAYTRFTEKLFGEDSQ